MKYLDLQPSFRALWGDSVMPIVEDNSVTCRIVKASTIT
jgi:hypothetical protein